MNYSILRDAMKFIAILLLLSLTQEVFSQTWTKGGNRAQDYTVGGDPTDSIGSGNEGFLFSTVPQINGFGTYAAVIPSGQYLGKGIRLTASLKVADVANHASLFMRVDGQGAFFESFDNMGFRGLRGDKDWAQYEIILDVPQNATEILFGILLNGVGQIWVADLVLSPADRTWERYDTFHSDPILCLQAANPDTVWAGSANGGFLRTTNGGDNWNIGSIPGATSITFESIAVIDGKTAVYLGNRLGVDARLQKTIDGGASWQMVYQNTEPGTWLRSVAFWDESNGIAVGDLANGKKLIITTSDGGANWSQVPDANIPPALPGEAMGFAGSSLAVAGEKHAWFGTAYENASFSSATRIFRTTDGGQSWTAETTPLPGTSATRGIHTIAFRDTLNGFAGNYLSPYVDSTHSLLQTHDGGRTWTFVNSLPFFIYPTTVAYVPQAQGIGVYAASHQGTVYSDNDGVSWRRMSTERYRVLDFADPFSGWATAGLPDNRIVKFVPGVTTDIEKNRNIEKDLAWLAQNQPNPFQVSTNISYTLTESGKVSLEIFTLQGQKIATLLNDFQLAGQHEVVWQATGQASGIYLYRLETRNGVETRKMILH